MAKPTSAQLALINKFAKEPLTEENCYVHQFRLIGTRLIEDRFLKLDKSLLDIYKGDVDNGNVVQIADHSFGGIKSWFTMTVPFGRFFASEIVEADGETHLDGWMYMKAGQKTYLQGFTTDDISEQLDAGTLHDSSVTIGWGRSECSICGNDIRDYENCSHIPGRIYTVNDVEQTCYVNAKPAEKNDRSIMLENSIVCVGAYPDAGHFGFSSQEEKPKYEKVDIADLKLVNKDAPVFCLFSSNDAQFLIKPEDRASVSQEHDLYHKIYSDGLPKDWTMGELVQKHTEATKALLSNQEHYLRDALDGTLPANLKEKSRREDKNMDVLAILKQFNIDPEKIEGVTEEGLKMKDGTVYKLMSVSDIETIKASAGTVKPDPELEQKVTELEAELATLKDRAADGEQYRKDLIAETLEWGVRAQGEKFDNDTWKTILTEDGRDIGTIKKFRDQFVEQANKEIPAGRSTQAGAKPLKKDEIPDEAYTA